MIKVIGCYMMYGPLIGCTCYISACVITLMTFEGLFIQGC